jgi:glucose-1-phosphate cytidylyltransferase
MKVVLFCGGLGTRLRDYSADVPKPLVPIGHKPILWHVMKYYAHFGHKDFILCLGYMGDKIKEYFLSGQVSIADDFVLSQGGKTLELVKSDTLDWRITCIDTGLRTNIGTRLKLVEEFLGGEEMFLANYTDGLTNMPLDKQIDAFRRSGKTACFMSSRPSQTFHVVSFGEDGSSVSDIRYVRDCDIWINAGYFIFRKEIFRYMEAGEDLVLQPFHRLIADDQLMTYKYEPFWAMDTFKEQQELTDMVMQGRAPWQVWQEIEVEPS